MGEEIGRPGILSGLTVGLEEDAHRSYDGGDSDAALLANPIWRRRYGYFDEFHERSLQADLALSLCLDTAVPREDLKILVMSATWMAAVAAFGWAAIITAQGQSYPVEEHTAVTVQINTVRRE